MQAAAWLDRLKEPRPKGEGTEMPAPQKAIHHYCGTSRGVSVRAS